jgi:hypothetical protein
MSNMFDRTPHPNFVARYPLSSGLGLKPVATGPGAQPAGFDIDEVEKALGGAAFQALLKADCFSSGEPKGRPPGQIQVFSCGHRSWPQSHADPLRRGCEVHCIYADDLELFLRQITEVKRG